ncbi:unnamed protein product [Paramecium primaurelia]|uniref:Protein kinase domain-containing protein n=1 Tax=Paramecium primaurelia TaxID=5886 RepID=A0A8S1QIG0_PARPR|nr:unnamed protein product [Paramecium primaurelia]
MNQSIIHFNEERLEDTYIQLELKKTTNEYMEFKCRRTTNDYNYIIRRFTKQNINNERFLKLRKIKLYNILPALDLYLQENSMASPDYQEYSLENNLEHMDNNEKVFVASLVGITLQELCKRKLPFLIKPDKVIIIGKHVCFQQIDFEFGRIITPEESFQSFIDLISWMGLECNGDDFQETIDYFLVQQNVNIGLTESLPYVEILQQIFQFANDQSMVDDKANSFVYVFDTPDFLKTIPGISNRTVMKSAKLDIADNKDYLILCSQRELEIMENFRKYEPFAYYFAYFRIQDQLYLFMELYPTDLSKTFENSEIYDRNVKDLCCQLAFAIRQLHKHRILHRDLKPANLFLSHEDLDRAQLKIADFDHSTTIEDAPEYCNQILTGLTSSTNYEPPETGQSNYTYTSDIWQIGMIFYQIANQGIYPVDHSSLFWTEDRYKEECTYEKIKQTLADKNIEDDFIKLIADCLSFNPQDRPNADTLITRLEQCFEDFVFENEETLQSTHQINLIESFGQLLSKSQPLRFTKSGNI